METFGYKSRSTFVHNLDPLVKVILYFILIVSVISWTDPLFLAIPLFLTIFFSLLAGDSLKSIIKTILIPFPAYIMIYLYDIFFFDYTVKPNLRWEPLYLGWVIPKIGAFGPFGHLSVEGLIFATSVSMRVAVFILASRLFLTIASPSDVTTAFSKLRIPMEITLALNVGFGYLPELYRQVISIMEAQKSRGWELSSKNPIKVAKAYAPIVVPIVTRSMERAEFLAATIASRGFGAKRRRITLTESKVRPIDMVFTILLLAYLGINILTGEWILKIASYKFTSYLIRSLLKMG